MHKHLTGPGNSPEKSKLYYKFLQQTSRKFYQIQQSKSSMSTPDERDHGLGQRVSPFGSCS